MFSRLMTEDQLVEYAVSLSSPEWQRIATEVSWLHRRGAGPAEMPHIFRHLADLVADPESWWAVRGRIKKLRREKYQTEAAARKAAAVERRREYMRVYMSARRRKERP